MALTADNGVVLRLSDYSESSQIVTLLTHDHGLARLIAKGARRATRSRPSVGLDLLEIGQMTFHPPRGDAGLGTLGEWKQASALLGLRRELPRLHAALYAAECTLAVTSESDACPEIFAALCRMLTNLAGETSIPAGEADPSDPATNSSPTVAVSPTEPPATILLQYLALLLREIGYAPNLRACVACGRARRRGTPAWFSSTSGGLVCADCESTIREKRSIRPGLLDAARGTTRPEEWIGLLDYHFAHLIGHALETARPLFALFTR